LAETGETVAVKKVLQDKRFKVCHARIQAAQPAFRMSLPAGCFFKQKENDSCQTQAGNLHHPDRMVNEASFAHILFLCHLPLLLVWIFTRPRARDGHTSLQAQIVCPLEASTCGAQGFRPSTAPNIPAAFALCSGMHDFKAFLPLSESFPSACVYPQNRELQIMKELKHTNVVELKDCFYIKGEKVSLREANLPNPLRTCLILCCSGKTCTASYLVTF
jgi:hypothetical protein